MPTEVRGIGRFFGAAVGSMFLVLLSCRGERREEPRPPVVLAGSGSPASDTIVGSLISLIGRPDRFNGSNIAVSGYLVLDRARFPHHDGFLFLRREDATLGFLNGVFVDIKPCEVVRGNRERPVTVDRTTVSGNSEKYVTIYGSFAAPKAETHFVELGSICGLTDVVVRHMTPPSQAPG